MTDETAAAKTEGSEQNAPQFGVLVQYVKDLSFENPNAPNSLAPKDPTAPEGRVATKAPKVDVNVDIQARQGGDTQYEVTLTLRIDARDADDKAMFLTELDYAGLFHVANVPEESLQLVLLVECPRMLFPFARQIIADATRNGGFMPVMLDPIDFAGLYRARMAQKQAEGAPTQH